MNPFRDTIVSNPWDEAAVDVADIQSDVFNECLAGIDFVRHKHMSAGLLIHGAAGAGKTHLLRRLRRRLTLQAPSATDRDECLFVWVRLQASPRMIWRHVRRTLVEDWFRPVRGHSTQFERILFHRLAELRVADGDLEPWIEFMIDTDPAALEVLLDQVADNLYLDRNTTIAFKHLAFNRHRRDLRAWLGGDSLPEEALARLNLSQDEGTDEDREHEARRVVLMLCKLAGNGLPIVMSLDQVEALQTTGTDKDGLFAFGQLASTLRDETSNVLVVSCVQSGFATELKDFSRAPDYDRITSLGARSLLTLTQSQAETLIAARLNLITNEPVRPSDAGPLWPLDQSDIQPLLDKSELIPRRVLAIAADRFDAWQRRRSSDEASDSPAANVQASIPQPAPAPLETFLDEEWKSRVEQAVTENRPERTEDIVRHGLPQLIGMLAPQLKTVRDERLPDVSLIFEGPAGRTGVSVCNQANMTSIAARFKRLNTQFTPEKLARLVVVRDARVPLTKGAKAAIQGLGQLADKGAVIAERSSEVFAALDALRSILSEAKAGDLAQDGRTVSPQSVEEWLKRHLPDSLREFVDCITGQSSGGLASTDILQLEALSTLLAERPVIPLEEAATVLKLPVAEITAIIERHPDCARLLAGPPALIFRVEKES